MAVRFDRSDALARLEVAEGRLRRLAIEDPPTGLTEPDPGDEERWEAGQVWAHLAEFVPYWLDEIGRILAAPGDQPTPFGRTKADAGRKAAIAAGVGLSPASVVASIDAAVGRGRALIDRLEDDDLAREGEHPTLGPLTVATILERFVVAHLHEHLDQLDRLRGQRIGA